MDYPIRPNRLAIVALCVSSLLAVQQLALAQQPPEAPPGTPPDFHGMPEGLPPGPERMIEHLHKELGLDEQRWPAVSETIQTILQLQHELFAGQGGRPPRPRDDGDANDDPSQNSGSPTNDPSANKSIATSQPSGMNKAAEAVRRARRTLGDQIHQPDSTPAEIHTAMEAFRAAKSAAKNDLLASQTELRSMLTEPQQAMLMVVGILD